MREWSEVETTVGRLIETSLPQLPAPVLAVMSMLSYEERALLFALGSRFEDSGAVVDAGCFLGGSTLSLASGLAAASKGRPGVIHTYDLLRVDPEHTSGYSAEVDGLEIGDSLRPLFEKNVAAHRDLVTLHQGDVLKEKWTGDPVEILFIDICKSWEINAHIVEQFFPALVPGVSVVVQQDLVHWKYPWCAIVMEHLSDHFEYLGWTWYASSVWRCRTIPTQAELSVDWREGIGLDAGLSYLRRSARRHTGWAIPTLELSRATLMHEFGENAAALAEVDRVETEFGTIVPYIDGAYAIVRELCYPPV
jgi:hypothetical protein